MFILLVILFVMKYDKDFKLNLKLKDKGLPKTDGNFEYGSSRFLTNKEIKNKFKKWDIGKDLKFGGIQVTTVNNNVYYDTDFDHTLIIGSTGSGKTVGAILPLIFNLGYANESMIINDTKGELYQITAPFLKDRGYDIKVINLRNALASDGWNPLHLAYKYYKIGNIDLASEIVENLSKAICGGLGGNDKYWENSSSAVLSALCYAIIEDAQNESEVNLFAVYNLLVEHGNKYIDRENSLDLYFSNKPAGSLSKLAYATGGFAKGETRGIIMSVLSSVLKIFSDTGISSLTSYNDFELDTVGRNKTAVFLVIPDEKESRHQLATIFIDQCYQALINLAQSNINNKLDIRVNFVLDEFANMPIINGISNKITVSRSRNIRFYLVIQDFDQLKEKYKDMAGTIKSNMTNWLYLLTSDNSTAHELSLRLGKYTISTPRVSTSSRIGQVDYNLSNDKNLMGRELLTADELMRLKPNEGIFLKSRELPIRAYLTPYYKLPLKIIKTELPNIVKDRKVNYFDLEKYRKNINNDNNELLDLY